MESVTRNVTLSTIVRVDGSRVPDSGGTDAEQNSYSLEVTKAVVGDGFQDMLQLAPLLFLDPDALETNDLWVLSVGMVKIILDDAAGTLGNSAAPQSMSTGPRMTVSAPNVEINRLDPDPSSGTSTIEFRIEDVALTPDETYVSQDYTVGEWVTYDNGTTTNKYTCTVDTTASQVPTDTGFWDDDGLVTFKNAYLVAEGYRRKVDQAPDEDDAANAAIAVAGGSFGDNATNAYIVPADGQAPYTSAGAVENTTIDLVDADITGGEYFTVDTPAGDYYVWYTLDAGGADPAVADRHGVQVDILTADTSAEIADKTKAAMEADTPMSDDVTVAANSTGTDGNNLLDFSNIVAGAVSAVAKGAAGSGLTGCALTQVAGGTDDGGKIWVDAASIFVAPEDTVEMVMGAMSVRNTVVDELDYDNLIADSTATVSLVFRFIA